MELFQTPLSEGCFSLNRIHGRCSGTESHPDKKSEGQKGAKADLSCSVLSGVSNSFRFLAEALSQCEAVGMAELWQGFLAGSDAEPGHRETRWAWQQDKAPGWEESCRPAQEQGPGHNPALSQR